MGARHFCEAMIRIADQRILRLIQKRLKAGVSEDGEWPETKVGLRKRMHEPAPKVEEWLGRVVRGFYQVHPAPGNWASLSRFRERIGRYWRRVLERRSQKGRLTADRVSQLCNRWLPRPYGSVRGGRSAMAVPTATGFSLFLLLSVRIGTHSERVGQQWSFRESIRLQSVLDRFLEGAAFILIPSQHSPEVPGAPMLSSTAGRQCLASPCSCL